MSYSKEIVCKIENIIRKQIWNDVKVSLFGSRANNTNTVYSDYDIMIDAGSKISLSKLNILRSTIDDEIPANVDIVDRWRVSEGFMEVAMEN